MSDLLNNSLSALSVYRQALDTVSHNIANANTPGYTRQQVEITAQAVGGVEVRQISRLTDSMVYARQLSDTASFSRLDTFQQLASRLDGLLSNADTGLAKPMQAFFTAADGVAADPSSVAARQTMLASAGSLTARFQDLQGQLDGAEREINDRMQQSVSDINRYTSTIAELNDRITLESRGGTQPPNDLLDQRDQLITELSKRLSVTTVKQDDGSLNVFAVGGQALVLGKTSQDLSLVPDAYNSGRLELAFGPNKINVNRFISGGELGGLLDARSQLLDPAQNRLGRVAVALSQNFNAQHAQGMDQNGALGGNFFSTLSATARPASANTGSATVAAGYQDVSQLTGDDYVLSYDGAAWQLKQASTGNAVPMTGAGTAASPFVAAGLSFQVSGGAAAGDSFRIEPTRSLAGQMGVVISDPAAIAAAAPIRAQAAVGNAGSGTVSAGSVTDASNPNLLSAVTIQFTSASTYSVNGAGSYAYTQGANIDVNGWRVQISGTPAVGDQFQVSRTPANSSDNRNASLLSGLSSKGVLDGGRSTLASANASLVSQTGSVAQQAQLRRDAQKVILDQTQKDRDAVSGVNLDEEAANMVRFQQAYQAAAQMIQVTNTLFQSLLSAARG